MILRNKLLVICLLSIYIVMSSCSPKKGQGTFDYGTKNDSALYHFKKGWEQIMDNGQWTLSETSFRKAIAYDPDFLIGKSLVGRISSDIDERLAIQKELTSLKAKGTRDERLLLDVYMLNIDIMNARSEQPDKIGDIIGDFRSVSEANFRKFVHTYPEESYIKAEYIEVLHAAYGAQVAIDSLQKLATQKEIKEVAFFKSYLASLEAELGNYDAALSYVDEVVIMHNDATLAGPYTTYADIYFKMDSLSLAKKHIDKAVALDAKHMIAQGLSRRIDQKILDQKKDTIF